MRPAAKSAACCTTRREVAEVLAIAARAYDESVVLLTSCSSRSLSKETYEAMSRNVTKMYQRAEEARVRFEEHVASHECFEETAEGVIHQLRL
jgi:hypothetical protein